MPKSLPNQGHLPARYVHLTTKVFNITSREQVIINTWYGGEMKKGMFSMMNYYLPLKGIASMHLSLIHI